MSTSVWTERIEAWIEEHRERMIADIVRLVRIESVSDKESDVKPYGQGCKDALDAMLEMARGYGFETHNYEDYFGKIWFSGDEEGPKISLWGHLDVVPEGEDWQYPAFEGLVKEGAIIGRGSQDNKGQVIATLYVMRCIRDLGVPLRHKLELYVGTDEEQGMSDLDYFLSKYPEPEFNLVPDSNFPVCFGEKGGFTLNAVANSAVSEEVVSFAGGTANNVIPAKSSATLRVGERLARALPFLRERLRVEEDGDVVHLHALGEAGHSAFPENSVNAIRILTEALCESGALNEADGRLFDFLNRINEGYRGEGLGIAREDRQSGYLICVGTIAGLRDGRPEATLNVRLPISVRNEPVLEQIEALAGEYGYSVEVLKSNPAHYFPEEHPVVERLTGVYNAVMGQNKPAFVLPGGTYCRKLKNSISFGMGFGADNRKYLEKYKHILKDGHGHAHGPDEVTLVELLEKAIRIYVEGLVEIDDLDLAAAAD